MEQFKVRCVSTKNTLVTPGKTYWATHRQHQGIDYFEVTNDRGDISNFKVGGQMAKWVLVGESGLRFFREMKKEQANEPRSPNNGAL